MRTASGSGGLTETSGTATHRRGSQGDTLNQMMIALYSEATGRGMPEVLPTASAANTVARSTDKKAGESTQYGAKGVGFLGLFNKVVAD